jgi:hypothetical protein
MDQNGISYFDWMDLITNTYDDALQKAHVDLKFGDNRALRNKELDFASGEWERIKFFKQRLPNTDDLCHVLDRFVDRMPEMEYGHRREYRLAVAHEVAVGRWLKGKVFAPEDRKYILDRERYLVAVDLAHHILNAGSKFVLEAIGLAIAGRRNKNWYSKHPQEGQRIAQHNGLIDLDG